MARRLTLREARDMAIDSSEDEMEVGSNGNDDSDTEYEVTNEEGDDTVMNTDTDDSETLDDNHMVENGDDEIESHPAPLTSEAENISNNNLLEDISGSDDLDFNQEWCKNLHDFPMKPDFITTPIDFYRLFITKEQIKKMKAETNAYATVKINKYKRLNANVSPRSMMSKWKGVTVNEIENFLAIIIHMSLVNKPKIQDYWAKHPMLETTFASKLMKRERFTNILAFFHLNDNSSAVPKGQPGFDPLHKVRPFIDHLNHTFQTTYIPEQHLSIDEAMCPWKGTLGFKVYMKDKPTRWGIKLYELCESQSGYVWRFEVFCGMPGLSNRPYDVVQRLLEPLKSLGYCVYTDRYYTSVALAEDLASCNTGFTGTVMCNRVGLPKEFMQKKLAIGEAEM